MGHGLFSYDCRLEEESPHPYCPRLQSIIATYSIGRCSDRLRLKNHIQESTSNEHVRVMSGASLRRQTVAKEKLNVRFNYIRTGNRPFTQCGILLRHARRARNQSLVSQLLLTLTCDAHANFVIERTRNTHVVGLVWKLYTMYYIHVVTSYAAGAQCSSECSLEMACCICLTPPRVLRY